MPLPTDHLDPDWQIRLEAFKALRAVTDRSGGVVTREELQAGFLFEGNRIPFASRGAGIWRPAALAQEVGAALSIMTSENGPYEDTVGEDGRIGYSYANGPIDNHFNAALRNAFRYRRPVIFELVAKATARLMSLKRRAIPSGRISLVRGAV